MKPLPAAPAYPGDDATPGQIREFAMACRVRRIARAFRRIEMSEAAMRHPAAHAAHYLALAVGSTRAAARSQGGMRQWWKQHAHWMLRKINEGPDAP